MFGRSLMGAFMIAITTGVAVAPVVSPPVVVSAAPATLPPRPALVPDVLRHDAPAWAWCGVDPTVPDAGAIVASLARDSGIDTTFGPCLRPPDNYSPIEPGARYASPEVYRQLVELNASAGMSTVVFDERLWSPDATERAAAIAEWRPYLVWIEAWDLGDEYDPLDAGEWAALTERFDRIRTQVTPSTGIEPFTNLLPLAVEQALRDIPGSSRLVSFVEYGGDLGVAQARSLDARVDRLMCGLNALDHWWFTPTPSSVIDAGQALQSAGCDLFLVFGGVRPYDTPGFDVDSVVDATGAPTALAPAVLAGTTRPDDGLIPVQPARLVDTRIAPPNQTVDGLFQGIGTRRSGSTVQLQVTGRGGVPFEATAVAVNVAVANPAGPGFVTVYPCGRPRPNAAVLNHDPGELASAFTVVSLGVGGSICVFNQTSTEVVVDVVGYHSTSSRYRPIAPGRLLETRPVLTTIDGQQQGIGRRPAGSVTAVTVAGRTGIPVGAEGAMLTVTATQAGSAGFVTVFPCNQPRPTASTLNVGRGGTQSNTSWVELDAQGRACLFNLAATELVVDVAGWAGPGHRLAAVTPARLMETRLDGGSGTIDGIADRLGRRVPFTETRLQVAGRGGVRSPAGVVALNIAVTAPATAGFVTVYTCDTPRPPTSNLNFVAGDTVANTAMVRPAEDGTVCVYTMSSTEIIVDVVGAQAATWPTLT